MLTPYQIQDRLEKVLLTVQKPGRYVGGEFNQVVKPWDTVEAHVALVFPDIYDIGIPNLGIGILYEGINNRLDANAERAYLPWIDMEKVMLENSIPLYSLETKHALLDFDIIGITLPYETLYTNALQVLSLSQIPLYAKDRNEKHPLIIAGGHATFNPEPVADFFDAFVIGDGEEVIHDIINTFILWKKSNQPRKELLISLSRISGVYIPSFYHPIYSQNNTLEKIDVEFNAPFPINKRITAKLPPPATHPLVPSIDVVHNRVPIEIMRGCTRGCRFCHAGMVNRPVRERSVAEIVAAIDESLKNTGYEEVALLSLSSSDYSKIQELVEELTKQFGNRNLTISLPSLRIETFSIDLMEKIKGSRPGGFTLAPEAATDRMRSIINKPIQAEQLLETVRQIYSRGWPTIKLYFMIGYPFETLEDVLAIADLCKAVLRVGHQSIGKRANLHVGISTIIPKAHTPFQWLACDTVDNIRTKQKFLHDSLRIPGIKYNWTNPQETLLEAWLSRGDRHLTEVIFKAWENGARFDAWQDQFNFPAWQKAFEQCSIDPSFYAHRQRTTDEIFPWDHIHTGVSKKYLLEEYNNSLEGILRPDCRNRCFSCGILTEYKDLRQKYPGADWKCPEIES